MNIQVYALLLVSGSIYLITYYKHRNQYIFYKKTVNAAYVDRRLKENFSGYVLCVDILSISKYINILLLIVRKIKDINLIVLDVQTIEKENINLLNDLKLNYIPSLIFVNKGVAIEYIVPRSYKNDNSSIDSFLRKTGESRVG